MAERHSEVELSALSREQLERIVIIYQSALEHVCAMRWKDPQRVACDAFARARKILAGKEVEHD